MFWVFLLTKTPPKDGVLPLGFLNRIQGERVGSSLELDGVALPHGSQPLGKIN